MHTDEELLSSFISENDGAFEAIYMRYFAYLRNLAVKKTGDSEFALDVCQEVFLSFYRKRDIRTDNLKAYLHTLLKNKILDYYRREAVREKYKLQQEQLNADTKLIPEAHQKLDEKDLNNKIEQVITTLPEQCKKVFLLSRKEGLTYQQIAEKLNLSVKTVEAHMTKAMRILRDKLGVYLMLIAFTSFPNL